MPKEHHILVLPQDKSEGKTYVIGDVHGALGAFEAVLDKLTPKDRLIILGDLIDRGESDPKHPTSANILDTFIAYNNAPEGTKPRLYALQGNHERNFLDVLDIFDRIKKGDIVSPEWFLYVAGFVKNGGAWIFKRQHDDLAQERRLAWFRAFSVGDRSPECEHNLTDLLKQIVLSKDPFEHLIPEIHTYRQLIESLPFLIQLEGEQHTLCVHSDLNIDDAEIDRRVLHQEGFTDQEITYMTDARVKDFKSKDTRTESSRLVLVGHNIINDEHDPDTRNAALPVRADTNHINLDCGAYFTQSFLVLNMTDNLVEIVSKDMPEEHRKLLEYAKTTIQTHLNGIELEQQDEPMSKRPRFS